jgi:hypothetical protein
MLSRLFWLIACPMIRDDHTRDWYLWDALGLSKCKDCRRKMTPPPQARRERL